MDAVALFDLLVALLASAWVGVGVRSLPSFLDRRPLEPLAPIPGPWPTVSVIVAACDEEHTIGPALDLLSRVTYPNLEIVVVNDRSQDRTGAILDAVAAATPGMRPVHLTSLPDGWLGKVHALHKGTARASGEWLLYTDADVHFQPGAIERAIAVAVRERLDHLTLWPRIVARSLLLRAAVISFGSALLTLLRPHRIGREGSTAYLGIGAFNLVRREALERTPGFEWLRMEVADDSALAKMIVDHGGRSSWRTGIDVVSVEWYPSVTALIRGLEKNVYGVFSHFRVAVFLVKASVLLLAIAALGLPWLMPMPWWVRATSGLAVLTLLVQSLLAARFSRFHPAEAALAPLVGGPVLLLALARSALACWRNGGIRWRGTFYPVAALRAGARLRL
jgi:cellulose synthase/poly-beta-1,6-N-acetylglucosamine synthase-like glycosyltransferase